MVVGANLSESEYIDDEEYWTDKNLYKNTISNWKRFAEFKLIDRIPESIDLSYKTLKLHGLKTVQITHRISGELLDYIEDKLKNVYVPDLDASPDIIQNVSKYFEGATMQVAIIKYERNREARLKCIAFHGCACKVCGINFEHTYGEIGKGFIHVHHIVPLATIGKKYEIDPINDLVPVCPNCHVMLHRLGNDNVLTIEELRSKLK